MRTRGLNNRHCECSEAIQFVGWVERSETHHASSSRRHGGFRKCSTHPTASQTRLLILAARFARALLRRSTLLSQEGAGKAGCRPAPAVRCAKSTRRKTAQQHTGVANHSAFPARWSDGLCRALPGAELSFWPPSPRELMVLSARLGSHTPPRQLDRSNDGQDHTVLPYASAPLVCTRLRAHRDYPPCP